METIGSKSVTIETQDATVTAMYAEDRQPSGMLHRWNFEVDGTFVSVQAWNVPLPESEALIANLTLGDAEELAAALKGLVTGGIACVA
jgi:hypothetical protein